MVCPRRDCWSPDPYKLECVCSIVEADFGTLKNRTEYGSLALHLLNLKRRSAVLLLALGGVVRERARWTGERFRHWRKERTASSHYSTRQQLTYTVVVNVTAALIII